MPDAVVGRLMGDTTMDRSWWFGRFENQGVININAKIDWWERLQELAFPVRFIRSDWYGFGSRDFR